MSSSDEQVVRGYELRERVGAGGFGAVYRAVQPTVGRDVAVKIILPEHASQPDFIRRFEVEAQLVARLEHPYIVPLYDYWREPNGAYLVMRYMRGGSLRAALSRGAYPPEAAARLIEQIAGALHAAHRQGIIHRDIKPENILLDEDGSAFLVDFGIAKDVSAPAETQTGVVSGSLAYISPEALQSQPLTPACDQYSLGVVLYEMLAGQHPFHELPPTSQLLKHLSEPLPLLSECCAHLPAALDSVIQRATAKDPAQRYPNILAFAAALHAALGGLEGAVTQPKILAETDVLDAPNPYKGLRAFQEADAAEFFGRAAQIQRMLARLGARALSSPTDTQTQTQQGPTRFLAVVGPSGSGKSSLVKAGLVPALRRGGLPGSERWFIVSMLPGAHPLEELEIGLLRLAEKPIGLMEQLRRDERGLLRAARLALPEESELLLVIDQFEELFTLVADKDETSHFLANLVAAVSDPHSHVRVIITLRADFYDRPLMDPAFSGLMQKYTEVVAPLSADELAEAIQKPAEQAGAVFEAGLVTAIIADLKDQPGGLPLLQYALTELYEHRRGRLLTRSAYAALGGVMGVLGQRAEEVYSSLDEAAQSAARQLFLRLVTLGEGSEDTRRRALRSELDSLSDEKEMLAAMQSAIEQFGSARLLSFDRDPQTRGSTVEVAHEALLREWKRLREWLDESRADVRQQRQMANAAAEWQSAGRDPGFLLNGARLSQFEGWSARTLVALTQEERAFMESSLAERQQKEQAENQRQQRELETAQKLAEMERARAAEQTHAAVHLRQRAVWLAGALVIAAALAIAAGWFGRQASLALNRSEAQRLAGEANQLILKQGNPELAALLALRSLKLEYTPQGDEALEGSARLDYPTRILTNTIGEPLYSLALSPDGHILASDSLNGVIYLWDTADGKELHQLKGHTGFIYYVLFSPDGRYLVSSGGDNTTRLWNVASGQEIYTARDGETIDFSPDGHPFLGTTAKVTLKEKKRGSHGILQLDYEARSRSR
jgi:hypothetical protein